MEEVSLDSGKILVILIPEGIRFPTLGKHWVLNPCLSNLPKVKLRHAQLGKRPRAEAASALLFVSEFPFCHRLWPGS